MRVAGEFPYRKDLFRGTAQYYDQFRPPYPVLLLDDLRARVPLHGTARVLDLGCGTGQIAFALAADIADVWAVDQEAESIEFGRRKAERLPAEPQSRQPLTASSDCTSRRCIGLPAEPQSLEPLTASSGCTSGEAAELPGRTAAGVLTVAGSRRR